MPRPVKTETWFIKDFYTKYVESKIRKPRIQRKKCWTKDQSKEYIEFIAAHENTCLPLSVNEVPFDGKHVYMLFDGNNRTNAILDFYHTPLKLLETIIPDVFICIKKQLQDTKLNALLKKKYSYLKFCKEHDCVPETYDSRLEDAWDGMIDHLENLHFEKVRIQITIYDNLTNVEMQNIYESINRGGMILTEQDLLASSLANQLYDGIQPDITAAINEYYEDINSGERLCMAEDVCKLNLFEILTGLQIVLHNKYGFIPEPNATKDLDIVFYIWKLQYGFATKEPFPPEEQVVQFISSLQLACSELHNILNQMYDTTFAGFVKFHKIKKTHVITSLLYFMYNPGSLSQKKQFLHKAIMYHNILVELVTDETISPEERSRDIFWRVSGGAVLVNGLYKRIKGRTFDMPDINSTCIQDALLTILKQNIKSVKTRKPLKWFEALALTAFYNQQIPSTTKLSTHQIDHIVPFSVRKNLSVDICRLGNKQLIPETINASRKVKPITDKWVTDNKLMYQHYPTGQEYVQIYDGTTLHPDSFNSMCERREQMYIDHILTSWEY